MKSILLLLTLTLASAFVSKPPPSFRRTSSLSMAVERTYIMVSPLGVNDRAVLESVVSHYTLASL
jgi:hypothetical protein